jgi:hypothetical protein
MDATQKTFAEFHAAGCVRTGCEVVTDARRAEKIAGGIFATLTRFGHGNICNGCPHVLGCKAFRKLNASAPPAIVDPHTPSNSDKYPGMSVKQIAAKLGVSMSEVRRRKHAGSL